MAQRTYAPENPAGVDSRNVAMSMPSVRGGGQGVEI